MLPFLDPKKISSVIISRKDKPDLKDAKPEVSTGESDIEMESVAEDILKAIDARSVKDLAQALRDAFALLEGAESVEPSLGEDE